MPSVKKYDRERELFCNLNMEGNMRWRTYSKNDALKRFASLKLQYRTMLCWKATPFKFAPRDPKSREKESTKCPYSTVSEGCRNALF